MSNGTEEADIYENMSDDDFANVVAPAPVEVAQIAAEDPVVAEPVAEAVIEPVAAEPAEPVAEAVEADDGSEAYGADVADADLVLKPVTPHQTAPKQADPALSTEPVATAPGSEPAAADAPPNYEEEYKRIMAPFKANNRDFIPSSPDEAIRLMQMGANYTKKMQALTPNLKLMRMLDNQGLLDEGKINFLIDLNRKDPGAIQKLLHDSKIDPLDLSTTEEPDYKPGNHTVSDQEMNFHDALGDTLSAPGGRETVELINRTWDKSSKEAIYKDPAVLAIINEQRANGIFDQISAEMDRQKTLGNLTNVPFLAAYKSVGDTLHSAGRLVVGQKPTAIAAASQVQPVQQARVLETRVAAVKPQLANDAAARAASATKSAPASIKTDFDPMNMSDAEIMALSSPPRAQA